MKDIRNIVDSSVNLQKDYNLMNYNEIYLQKFQKYDNQFIDTLDNDEDMIEIHRIKE